MKRFIFLFIICIVIFSCIFGPDDEDFSFSVTVKDTDGNPVEGLNISLLNKINCPFWNELNWETRAQTTIVLTISYDCNIELYVEDIERNRIRTLINEEIFQGFHNIIWNGTDDDGNYLPNGVYYSTVVFTRNDTISFQAERTMYLMSLGEYHKNGTTDTEGKFSTINRKPFINLSDADSLEVVDCDGNTWGLQTFSDTTAVCITDPENDDFLQIEFMRIADKNNEINITWNPENKTIIKNTKKTISPASSIYKDGGNIVNPILEKIANYPNPFI
ncbi:MAG: FlgD immunoglobulin-like domain containing protein [Candidatus Tenebribacter burtonii]|jgi:hypothetical protein|nr:FlgD immunoglobulin-like domain containing protein [Candidatus Tenebribacter burtonii]